MNFRFSIFDFGLTRQVTRQVDRFAQPDERNPSTSGVRANVQSKIKNQKSKIRHGFSFAEVMFAVVILGIGFIMVAAVFPVAIKQGQATAEESFTAAVARNGGNYLAQVGSRSALLGPAANRVELPILHATDLMLTGNNGQSPPRFYAAAGPGTVPDIQGIPGNFVGRGKMLALGDSRVYESADWETRQTQMTAALGNVIVASDPRYAWVPLFKRDRVYSADGRPVNSSLPLATLQPTASVGLDNAQYVRITDSSVAQVVMFGVQVRNRTSFTASDLPAAETNPALVHQYNLQPRPVAVCIVPETLLPNGAAGSPSNYVVAFQSVTALTGGDPPRGGFPAGAAYNRILDEAPKAVAEGCYVVISDDRISRQTEIGRSLAGSLNGRIFRIASERTDLEDTTFTSVWDLFPGYDFSPDNGFDGVPYSVALASNSAALRDDIIAIGVSTNNNSTVVNGVTYTSTVPIEGDPAGPGAIAYIMGKGLSNDYLDKVAANPNTTDPPTYEGLPMDVSVYTTIIKVK